MSLSMPLNVSGGLVTLARWMRWIAQKLQGFECQVHNVNRIQK